MELALRGSNWLVSPLGKYHAMAIIVVLVLKLI